MLADENILSFISLSAHIQPTEFYSAFVVIFIISFSIGCGSGLDIIKYQHSSKLCSLAAMPWGIALPAELIFRHRAGSWLKKLSDLNQPRRLHAGRQSVKTNLDPSP